MKSRTEIEELKAQWKADPVWDIWTTEGFEAHRDELIAYQSRQEAIWERKRQEELRAIADDWGLPQNMSFSRRIEALMRRVQALEEQLNNPDILP